MQLRYLFLRILTTGCALIALAGCGSDDRIDRLLERQEQMLDELRNLSSTYQALIARGLMVVPERMLQEGRGKSADSRGGPPRVPVAGNSPLMGKRDAKVTVIEFGDFECPFCAKMAGVGAELLAEYPGQVGFVYKNFPLKKHPNAVAAAIGSRAAYQQGKFWEMHDAIFQSGDATKEGVRAHAVKLGLDMDKFDRDVASPKTRQAVFLERRGGRAAGVKSTPTFFVAGKRVQVPSKEALKLAVASELERNGKVMGAAGPAASPSP